MAKACGRSRELDCSLTSADDRAELYDALF
jgi:hypothetical protein